MEFDELSLSTKDTSITLINEFLNEQFHQGSEKLHSRERISIEIKLLMPRACILTA